jgi:hypothetical protein
LVRAVAVVVSLALWIVVTGVSLLKKVATRPAEYHGDEYLLAVGAPCGRCGPCG